MNKLFPVGTSNKKKAVLLSLGATVALICRAIYRIYYVPRSLRHIPSVGYFRLIRSILRREDATTRARTVYGPAIKKGNGIYLANFPITWSVFVSSPIAAKSVLMKTDNFPKSMEIFHALGKENPVVRFFGIDNVAIVNGEKWKKQRKVMNPAFHRAMPVQMFGRLMLKGFKNIEKQDYQVPILDFFQRLTLDALGIAGFGFDFHSVDDPESIWTKTYENVRLGLRSPFSFLFPSMDWLLKYIIPGRKELDKSVDKLNALLMSMAQERRLQVRASIDDNVPDSEKDLLTLMLEAELRGEGTASDEQLRSNLAVFFLAGHETTANTMSFCLYNLAMNKEVQSKARQEVLTVLGDEPVDILPQIDELRQMPYIDMVLKENLRRFGPASMLIARKSQEDFDLNGVFIPKNTPVVVETHALHHNPDVWKNPEQFDPERFAPGGEHETCHEGMAWLPFSSGSRGCLGMNFSLAEQRTFLVMLLRKYEWELPEDSIHRNGVKIQNFQNAAPESLEIKFSSRY
ncbi:cytochrome P450 [Absidia repens]|uniref:Cytochrome P450 n=1 Tax=Absidia repens TaxID=90262 RepID=A0A1X2IUG5_9FUNG|nr:cytochrome P450 [Absidia repens]